MKTIILFIIKVFRLNIPAVKVVEVPVYVEVEKLVALDGVINGNLTVKGDLTVKGTLTGTGEISCYKIIGGK